jgi:solute:Na+ symporter, SSS family
VNLPLLIAIVLVYLLLVGYLAFLGFKHTKTSSDFLVAGRSVHPVVMALSYGATLISTSAIVGFGGVAGLFGMGLMWLTFISILVGVFIAFVVFGRRTHRIGGVLDAQTFPGLLGRRFQSDLIQGLAGAVIFLAMPLYAAVVLMGGARFIEATLTVDYDLALMILALVIAGYVLVGGLKAVMYTDALQGGIMVLGMLFLFVMAYVNIGGPTAAHEYLQSIAGLVPDSAKALGHRGWTAMPEFGSPWWWTLLSTLVLGVGIGALAQPQLVVRFMTVKSGRSLDRSVLIAAVFVFVVVSGALMTGTISNVFFHQTQGDISIAVAGGNPDLIIPLYITAAMPTWFGYVFMLTLLAAAMSTLSSHFHTMGTAIGHDVVERILSTDTPSSLIARIGVVVSLIVSVFLAYTLPAGFIARGTAIFFGVCAASFLPTYAAALYWKGATRWGAISSIASGLASSLFCLVFLHAKEAQALGISQALFGRAPLIETHPWPFVDPMVISLPIAALTLVMVSHFTKKLPEAHVRDCFR